MTDDALAAEKFVNQQLGETLQSLGDGLAQPGQAATRHGPLDIAIPVHQDAAVLERCLDAVLDTISKGDTVWLIDDAGKDPQISRTIRSFAHRWPGTRIVTLPEDPGPVAVCNHAIRSTRRDLVLLNSAMVVQAGWLEHLQSTLLSNPRAGIVCPISDHATLLSVLPGADDAAVRAAAEASAGRVLLPTAVGLCMLISRRLLDQVGPFDSAFSAGDGEENDLSMRAMKLGYDIQVADQAVVLHKSAGREGGARSSALRGDRHDTLRRRWPEYAPLVQSWWRENPLREKAEHLARPADGREVLVHVLHRQYHVGGTERIARGLIRELNPEFSNTLLYPGETDNPWCDFERRPSDLCRELMLNNRWLDPRIRLAGHGADFGCLFSQRAFARVVRGSGARIVHFHHLLHWDSLLLPLLAKRLGARTVVGVHDFFFNCPIHNQLEYDTGQPCGRKFAGADERCVSCLTRYAAGRDIPGGGAAYARGRHALLRQVLSQADAIVAPSHFMRGKLLDAFGAAIEDRLALIPHGTERPAEVRGKPRDGTLRLGYFGGDQVLKGASLVLRLADALRDHPVHFNVYGRVKGFRRERLPDNVTLHGYFNPGDVGQAMADLDLTLIPSFYEESYSLILSESLAHSVPALTSERGALAERVVKQVNGWTVPDMEPESWLAAIESLLEGDELERVRKRLAGARVVTTEETAEEYAKLYRRLLDNSATRESGAEGEHPPSEFVRRLRRFRSRHCRRDAHWYGAAATRPGVRPKCVGIVRDLWGTAQYRVRYPLLELAEAGDCESPELHIVKQSGFSVLDTCRDGSVSHILVQPFLSDPGLAMMEQLARLPGKQVLLVVDDLWTQLADDNPVRDMMPPEVFDRLCYAASLSHQVVLTSSTLQRCLGLRHPSQWVVENALPAALWGGLAGQQRPEPRSRLRIGWAGAPQHQRDLELLEAAMHSTRNDAEWVFIGMCPERLRPLVSEHIGMLPFAEYPAALAGAGLDLALAPLQDTAFNRCKSHLKVLEYGVLGIPVIASALDPYLRCPVTLVDGSDGESWREAIEQSIEDPELTRHQATELQVWVQENHMLHHRRAQWRSVLTGECDAD